MTLFQNLLCADDERRAALRLKPGLYGIDFLEIRIEPPADNQRVLELSFQGKENDPGLDGFLDSLNNHPELFILTGGIRIQGITIDAATRNGDVIELRVSEPGDFSDYTLRVDHVDMDP